MKKLNLTKTQQRIIQIVREFSPISRTNLANHASLPQAAITRSIKPLLANKFLIELPQADTSGIRRKKALQLNPDLGYCVGIEYTPHGIEIALVNFACQTVFKNTVALPLAAMPRQEKIHAISQTLNRLLENPPINSECLGVALVDPGSVDSQSGVALFCTTLEDWQNVPIVDIISAQFNLPVRLFNTSQARIRAVDQFETRRLSENLMYIEYAEGIGCGLKLEGKYVRGAGNLAGELGHVKVTDEPIVCRCGGFGCLEAVAALPAIAKKATQSLSSQSSSILAQKNSLSGEDVLAAAAQGDRLALNIIETAFDYIAKAIAAIINVVSPEIVILDPHFKLAGQDCLHLFIRNIKKYSGTLHRSTPIIRACGLDSHIGSQGGALRFLDSYFE